MTLIKQAYALVLPAIVFHIIIGWLFSIVYLLLGYFALSLIVPFLYLIGVFIGALLKAWYIRD